MSSKRAKHRKALREIAISNLKKDRNFFVVGLTYGCRKLCKPFFSIPAASSMEENRFLKFNGLVKFPSASGINGASSPKYRSLRNSIIACTAVSFKGTIRLLEAVFSLPTTISRPLFRSVPLRFWHHKRACIFSP